MFISIPPDLKAALERQDCYLVGGATRDYFLQKKELTDFDFVIFGQPDLKGFSQELADKTDSAFVELDSENEIYRVVNETWQADISAPRGETLAADLGARDFTINAIAYSLKNGTIHDPLDGQTDLKCKTIRAIGQENLQADPLRLLRAYRIAAQTGFTIENQTQAWIAALAKSIETVAKERVSYEIWLLLEKENSFANLKGLLEVGLWETIFPEFRDLRKVPPNDFHHLPLCEHTFELIRQYETVVKPKLPVYALQFIANRQQNNIEAEATLKMACLLHDIAKPDTWKIVEGRHTFYGHDKLGAEKTEEIGKKNVWPKQVTSSIAALVNHHLRPFQVAPLGSEATEKAERRFFRQLGDDFYLLIALAWADLLSTRGPMVSDQIIETSEERLIKLCEHYRDFSQQETETPLLLKGDLLVQAISDAQLAPTKQIKELLAELRELQLAGSVTSAEEAYSWFVKAGQEK